MRVCVMFLLTGPSHLPNLAVCVRSLRKWWSGDVKIGAWPESILVARQIAADPRVDAEIIPCDADYKGKNAQEIAKIALIQTVKSHEMVIYLDADLLIQGSIAPLYLAATQSPVAFSATQFCDWTMQKGIPRGRVERLFPYDEIPRGLIEAAVQPEMPSYNSGIFASRPDSEVLPTWGKWTEVSRKIYISGESSLHPIAQKYPIATLWGGKFNCSTIYQSPNLPDDQVAIWHFHGDSNLRPGKSLRGFRMWWPHLMATMDENIGGIRDWWSTIAPTNGHLMEAWNHQNDYL